MSDLQKCLSAFAVAAWSGGIQGVKLAEEAIDAYLEPHRRAGTVKPALEALERAFRQVGTNSTVAAAIRIDLSGRIQTVSEAAQS